MVLICFIISVIYFYEVAKLTYKISGSFKYLKTIWLLTAGTPVIGILVALFICIVMMRSLNIHLNTFEKMD